MPGMKNRLLINIGILLLIVLIAIINFKILGSDLPDIWKWYLLR